MRNKWIIYDNHIAIDAGDDILHPNADEVYRFVSGEADTFNVPNPIEELNYLRFSKIGSPIKCEVISCNNDSIYLNIYAIRKNKKCPIDMVEGKIIDHSILDNEWFYINEDVETLQKKLELAEIKRSGEISVGQYLNLVKQELFAKHKDIFDSVDPTVVSALMISEGDVPNGINATLYPYQKTGYLWMRNMLTISRGCILGDEMGLGKTLQIITIFQDCKNNNHTPFLVIAPVSLLENWKRECGKFAPELDVLIHHGSKRTGLPSELLKHDVVVISYSTAVSDLSMLRMINWWCVVLDEAQNIKNPFSERAKSVKTITRRNSIAVTGTPFENHITDIWSLVDFSVPGFLGTLRSFQKNVPDDLLGAEKIEPILSSIMIRRVVDNVANDLPEKIIVPQPLVMSETEKLGYEKFRQIAYSKSEGGSAVTLSLLQKLRMYCTHQSLCDGEVDNPVETSIKYQRLCELIDEIISRDEKVIVFTSYKKMFDIFLKDIPKRFGIKINAINGETHVEERLKIVDWFNCYNGPAMLVLNPRAAGTGLNITGANHVIHYNLEWNPSLEDQSSARAYRRGQNKTVFIYRLYYVDTVEQIINERIERKRAIASTAVIGTDGADERNDILRALELTPELI